MRCCRSAYAIHELANQIKAVSLRDAHKLDDWKQKMKTWEVETKALMESLACTELEVSSFWDYTKTDLRSSGRIFRTQHLTSVSRRSSSGSRRCGEYINAVMSHGSADGAGSAPFSRCDIDCRRDRRVGSPDGAGGRDWLVGSPRATFRGLPG